MTLHEIESELQRLGADDASVTLDEQFDPEAGVLVKFELAGAYWHLLPEHFLALLKDLSDNAGGEAIRTVIEKQATYVWHGPAPEGSRDTSP